MVVRWRWRGSVWCEGLEGRTMDKWKMEGKYGGVGGWCMEDRMKVVRKLRKQYRDVSDVTRLGVWAGN